MKRVLILALVSCGLAVAGPATAALVDEHLGGGQCYSRVYDAAHMDGHPDQLVTEIHLGPSTMTDPDPDFTGTMLDFGFTLRRGSQYSVTAYCLTNHCSLEGDSGHFWLAEDGEALRLSIDDFVTLEGRDDFSPDLADSDDKVFLLYPAKAGACIMGD
jgi:hypothetical protein